MQMSTMMSPGNKQALQIIKSSSYPSITSMAAIKHDNTEKDNGFIKTTESDDFFINTTESDSILNNSLSQPTGANYLNVTRGNISRTESAVSIPGDTSYVDTNPTILFISDEVGASASFDNVVTPNSKGRTSTTERRQPLKPPEVQYAIQNWATTFIRKQKHNPRLYQHHLQLTVPMDDETLDSAIFKDHRYVLSVLVPICVVAIGAAMIMATVFSLRYVARRRAVGEFPLTDGSCIEKQEQSICRISSERTDRILLLSVEEDADI